MAVVDMAVSTIMLVKSVYATALTFVAVATVVGTAAVPAIMSANNAISIATRIGIKVVKAGLNAKKAGRAWILVMKGVQKVRKFGSDFNKLSRANKALKVFTYTQSAYSVGNKIEQVTSYENRSLAAQMMNTDVYSAYKIYEEEIAKDFKENANPEIANIIDSKFPVHIATEIKKRWANQKLEKDAIDWFGLAGGILTAISTIGTVAGLVATIDPTGFARIALDLVDVANAFLKPPCKRPPDFPTLSRNYLIIQ
jgi:hypothetical protein